MILLNVNGNYRYQVAASLIFLCLLIGSCAVETEFVTRIPENMALRLEVEPKIAILKLNDSLNLSPAYYNSTGAQDTTVEFHWKSLDTQLVVVGQPGQIIAIAEGEGRIEVTVEGPDGPISGLADTISILVFTSGTGPEIHLKALTMEQKMLSVGKSLQLIVEQDTGTSVSFTDIEWVSTDSMVLLVSSSGLVEAESPGQAGVYARYQDQTTEVVQFTVPTTQRSAQFKPRPGSSYEVAGVVVVMEGTSGALDIAFGGDFTSSQGPGLGVYLSPTNQVTGESLRLGPLQANQGEQHYNTPTGTSLLEHNWVIIHCEPFDVTFGYAQLN